MRVPLVKPTNLIKITMEALIPIVLLALFGLFFRLYKTLIAEPELLRSKLRKQGLSGPPPALLLGNIKEIQAARSAAAKTQPDSCDRGTAPQTHDCASALLPFLEKWRRLYGDVFMFSLGNIQIVHVTEVEMVKEISTCTSIDLGKPSYQQKERGALLGQGILTSNGSYWAHQRKIIAPELYMDKVKGMTGLITKSALTLVSDWKERIEGEKAVEIKIDDDMRSFSGDVISMTCFGSNFSKGREIFKKLKALQEATSKKGLACGIPGMRHIPTKHNRLTWALDKEVKTLILKVVKERVDGSYEKDLLQMLLEGAKNSTIGINHANVIDNFIVDNCKNIYLAGYETTAVSAAWCLMLLAANKEWQDRVRAEVFNVCHDNIENIDYESVRKLKQLNMVIHECLRLYPPVAVVSREALKDMKFGNLNVPKGVNIWALVLTLHTDPKNWGSDSFEFKPDRFANGITGACKVPQFYMPFGVGPRICLGQNLAMLELKILMAHIVSNFTFSLSPNYIHSPALNLVIEPGHGVNILLKNLS